MIARAASASAISAFWKNSQVQINFKLNGTNRMITYIKYLPTIIANEPAERRREAGEAGAAAAL